MIRWMETIEWETCLKCKGEGLTYKQINNQISVPLGCINCGGSKKVQIGQTLKHIHGEDY